MGIAIGFLGLGKLVGSVGGFLARKGVIRGTVGKLLGGGRAPRRVSPRPAPRPQPRATSPRTRRTGARRSGQRSAPGGRPSSVSGAGARIVPRSRGAALRAPAMGAAVVGTGLVAPRLLGGQERPRTPMRRGMQQLVPFGRQGRLGEIVPLTDRTDKLGRPLVVQADQIGRTYCAPGYVAVTFPNGEKVCVLKRVAQAAGLWKARKKGPISPGQWSYITGGATAKKKAKETAQKAGFKVTQK